MPGLRWSRAAFLRASLALVGFLSARPALGVTVSVDQATRHQTMIGYGAADTK